MVVRRTSGFFLSQRVGRWRWPWLILSLAVSVIVLLAVAAVLLGLVELGRQLGLAWAEEAAALLEADEVQVATDPSVLSVELLMVGLTFWIPAVVASLIHGRSARSLLTPRHPFRWSIVAKVLSFQAVATVASSILLAATGFLDTPTSNGFGLRSLAWLLPLALIVLVQTSGEDVFFKGYLLRQLGAATGLAWVAPLAVVAIFVVLHLGNPDLDDALWLVVPAFVVSELIIVYLVIRTGGIEAALAMHWLNNFFIVMVLAEQDTQANELTIFSYDDDPTTVADDIPLMAAYGLFLVSQLIAHVWPRSPFFLARSESVPAGPPLEGGEIGVGPVS